MTAEQITASRKAAVSAMPTIKCAQSSAVRGSTASRLLSMNCDILLMGPANHFLSAHTSPPILRSLINPVRNLSSTSWEHSVCSISVKLFSTVSDIVMATVTSIGIYVWIRMIQCGGMLHYLQRDSKHVVGCGELTPVFPFPLKGFVLCICVMHRVHWQSESCCT